MNNNPLALVPDSNAQSTAYEFIKQEILALRLQPQQRLNAGELAAALGMSRTPIREALVRLEHERLVSRDPIGGFLVRGLTLREIHDVYRVREALEVEAALEALARMTPGRVETLAAALKKAEALLHPKKYAEFVLANRVFHGEIVRASGNAAFELVMGPIVDRVRLVGAMLIQLHEPRQREVYEENLLIFNALKKGDAKEVEAAVRAHVSRAREHAQELLSSNHSALVLHAVR